MIALEISETIGMNTAVLEYRRGGALKSSTKRAAVVDEGIGEESRSLEGFRGRVVAKPILTRFKESAQRREGILRITAGRVVPSDTYRYTPTSVDFFQRP